MSDNETIIEVVTFDGRGSRRIDTAEALTPEDAIFAGQTLHDEALTGNLYEKVKVGFYVEGKLVRIVDGRPRLREEDGP